MKTHASTCAAVSAARPTRERWRRLVLLVLGLGLALLPQPCVDATQAMTAIAHWSVPLREPPRDVLTGDTDGDGQREIVVVGRNGYLAVLEADGKLVWQTQRGEESYAAYLADLDGDASEELLIGGPRGVTALRGDGQEMWFYRTGYGVDAVTASDTNGDGRNEVVAATSYDHVYELAPTGKVIWHFWPKRQGFEGTVRGLAVADFDDDHQKEVAVAFDFPGYKGLVPAGHIRLLDHDGRELWLRQLRSPVLAIAAVDPDGWGRYLIAAGTEAGEFLVLFGDNSLRWYHDLGSPIERVFGADVDNDRQGEIVVVTEWRMLALDDDGSLLWDRVSKQRVTDASLGDLEGSIGRPLAVLSASPGVRKSTLELVDVRGGTEESYLLPAAGSLVRMSDLNMDGWAELVLCSNEAIELLSRARGAAHSRQAWSFQAQDEITALGAADVDADGRFEVLVGSQDKNLYVLKDDGTLSWRYPAPGAVRTVNTGDVDADGQLEVIVGYNEFDQRGDPQGWGISVLRGDGRALWQYQMGNVLWSVGNADLNGDGKEEVVVGTGANQVVAISGGHQMWTFATQGSVVTLFAGDVNGSGRAAVMAGSEDNHAYLLFGNGMQRWSYDTGSNVVTVQAADLNNDTLSEALLASEQGVLYALRLDGVMLWQRDLNNTPLAVYTGNWNGDGQVSIAIGTRGGDLYMLNGDGQPIWQYAVQARLSSVCPGDVDGDRHAELVAGSLDGVLYVVSQGGRLEGRHEVGDAISALWAGDTDGDGRAEILAGTRDGRLAMYEHTPNRPPLVANPTIAGAEAGYVYSVSVNDPENDKVDVTLEVLEPFSGVWRSAGAKSVTKPGVVYWFVDPFPLLASGRTAAYRLVYSDGLNTGTIGPLLGPRVPGLPWYTYAVVPALVGVVAWGYLTWRRSPSRYAGALYARLARNPQDVLVVMRELALHGAAPAETLIRLSRRARARGDQTVAGLAEGYLLLSSRAAAGLQVVASALVLTSGAPSGSAEASWGEALVELFKLLADLLEANSVARVAVLRPRMQHVLRLLGGAPAADAKTQALLDGVRDALSQLLRVARLMRNSERAEAADASGRLEYLAQASELLGAVAGLHEGPEQEVLAQVATQWQRVVDAVREEWEGRAQLRCRLRTKRIVATGEALLVLEVQNKGRSPALDTRVDLAADGSYTRVFDSGAGKTLGSPVMLGTLLPGHMREAELRLIPPAEDHFRVEFVLRYDDREAKGKSQLYADIVEVLQPSEFMVIPNPYVPGRPLRPASPIFYGRQEVFDFVANNAGGLLQRNILILIGQRRTGKTSMLLQLPLHVGEQYLVVYVDCQSMGLAPGLPAWLYDVAMAIGESVAGPNGGEGGVQVLVPDLAAFERQPARVFEHEFLDRVQAALGERTLLLVLDEFEELETRVRAGHLDATIFSYLRHLMQHTRQVAFVFVGTHRLEEMTSDYWSVLFNIALYRHIGYLDESSALHLITEPVQPYQMVYDDLALHRMLQVTAGHPYFLQLLCYSLVNAHNRTGRSYTTVDDVDQALEEILTLGGAHFAFLWESSAKHERATLIAMTRLLPHLGQAAWPRPGASASDVALLLAEQGLTLDPREVSAALRSLAAREILQEVPGDVERYVFKVGLVALWIERYRSLQKVIEELA